MAIDWATHFSAGASWLDLLVPARALTIMLIENEGPRPEFRRKLRRRLDAWNELEGPLGRTLEGRLRVLSEPWASLSLRDPSHRQALATKLADVDLVIAGPLSALGTEGGGTLDEIREFETFMRATRELVDGPLAFLLIHHPNRAGQVSGAWERAPDTLVHVQDEGHGRTRVFWQKVKWCSALHKTTHHLVWADGDTYTVEEREEITEETMVDEILEAVREDGGASWSKIRPKVRGNDGEKADARDRLIRGGQLVNTAAREGTFKLWVSDDPAAPRAESSTGLARVSAATPERESEAVRATVPTVGRHGAQHGTDYRGSDEIEHMYECIVCDAAYKTDLAHPERLRCATCAEGVAA